jgi:hypothetical protein
LRTRTAVTLAGALALLVVLPVAVIVGLGIAGGSQGGSVSTVSASGEQIRLIPAGGPPGTEISVYGLGWSPRRKVRLSLQLGADQLDPQAGPVISLGELVTSRTGEFESLVTLPAMALGPNQQRVLLGARYSDGGAAVETWFLVEPPANRLEIAVAAGDQPASGAQVAVSDAFGRELARALTGADGVANFPGLPPGRVRINARAPDYRPLAASAQMESEGIVTVRMRFGEPAILRLVIPDPDNPRRFTRSSIEIDRRSGLVVDREFAFDPADGRRRPVAFVYQLPQSGFEQPALAAVSLASRQISNYFYFNSGFVLYLGSNGVQDYVFAHDNAFQRRRVVFVYDRTKDEMVRSIELTGQDLAPLVEPDGSRIYVFNWQLRKLQIYDTTADFALRTITGLPEYISATTLDPATGTLWMTSALRDDLTPLDLDSGTVGDSLPFASDLITLTFDSSRNRIYGVSYKQPEIVMVDLDSGQVRFAEIKGQAMWVWPDVEGQLLFAAIDFGKSLQILDKDTLETVQLHEFVPARDSGAVVTD